MLFRHIFTRRLWKVSSWWQTNTIYFSITLEKNVEKGMFNYDVKWRKNTLCFFANWGLIRMKIHSFDSFDNQIVNGWIYVKITHLNYYEYIKWECKLFNQWRNKSVKFCHNSSRQDLKSVRYIRRCVLIRFNRKILQKFVLRVLPGTQKIFAISAISLYPCL